MTTVLIRVITKLPNSEQSYKGKVKTHNYINRQNQSTTKQRQLDSDTPQHDHRANTETTRFRYTIAWPSCSHRNNSVQIHHSMTIVFTQRQLDSDTPQHDHRANTETTRFRYTIAWPSCSHRDNSVQIHHSMTIVLTQRQLGSDTPQHDHHVNRDTRFRYTTAWPSC